MTPEEIVKSLAEYDPSTESYQGNVSCFFCGKEKYGSEKIEHSADCLWIDAQKTSGTL